MLAPCSHKPFFQPFRHAAARPVSLVTVLGKLRTGKSYLLNCLAGGEVFGVSAQARSFTVGVHLSSSLYEPAAQQGSAVELADNPVVAYCDMEGQGDQGVRYDIKLATPMLLLSQVLILTIVCPHGPERDSMLKDTLKTLLDAARQLHTGEEQGDAKDSGPEVCWRVTEQRDTDKSEGDD